MSYLQFMAANSFRYSALYTRPTVERGNVTNVRKTALILFAVFFLYL